MRENPGRYWRAVTVMAMIRLGWQPPIPDDRIAARMLDDMGLSGYRMGEKHLTTNATIDLSPYQVEVLAALAEGKSQPQIAEERAVSLDTIATYVKVIRSKLGAKSTTHAVAVAIRRGLI